MKKTNKIKSVPGGPPPLHVYVSANGEGRTVRVDGKLSARILGDFKWVEWDVVVKKTAVHLHLRLLEEPTASAHFIRTRGLAQGYFSLQMFKTFMTIDQIKLWRTPELVHRLDSAGLRTLEFKLPLTTTK